MKLPGPDHPITIAPNAKRVRVIFGDKVIANTTRALTLREASYPPVQYIPRADAAMDLLKPAAHASHPTLALLQLRLPVCSPRASRTEGQTTSSNSLLIGSSALAVCGLPARSHASTIARPNANRSTPGNASGVVTS